MVKHLILFVLCQFALPTFAQNYEKRFEVGVSTGVNITYADLPQKKAGITNSISLNYQSSRIIAVGVEAQAGKVLGGNKLNREFVNQYQSIAFISKFKIGAVFNEVDNQTLQSFTSLYLGLGAGAIKNKLTKIIRVNSNGIIAPGEDKGVDLWVPISLGLYIPLKNIDGESRFALHLNYQGNFTFGEGLDGFNNPANHLDNKSPDIFTVFAIGFKYTFGQEGNW